jgi:hypothetical protein
MLPPDRDPSVRRAIPCVEATALIRTVCPFRRFVADLISQGGREARLRSSAAIEAFEHAVMVYRVGLIRAMVDEEKLSFAEVARLLGVSRQMVARLYRHDECIHLG